MNKNFSDIKIQIQNLPNIGRYTSVRRAFVFFAACIFCVGSFSYSPLTYANPAGGRVTAGSAVISSPDGRTVKIHQTSEKAVIDWRSYNISPNETTQYVQPGKGSIALNRIDPGQGASIIAGNLKANGQVWLVNPAGIMFTSTARVDVSGLLATTANISNEDFMSGNYKFVQSPDWNGSVINNGEITVADEGMAALVAPGVENNGVIRANLGKVALASGTAYTVDLYGDQLIHFGADAEVKNPAKAPDGRVLKDAVSNSGAIYASGGSVLMTAKTAKSVVENSINMKGYVEAKSVVQKGGSIILSGGDNGTVSVSGQLIASGKQAGQKGGTVKVLGKQVKLVDQAEVDVSGDQGGGEILVGGNAYGKGTEQNAVATFIGKDVKLNADALTRGDGGKIIVWADDTTLFYGDISARGGREGGNGGFVETSGKEFLEIIGGHVDASAEVGNPGIWLLDPRNVTISATTSSGSFDGGDPNTFTPTGNSATVSVDTINTSLNGGTSVIINTGSTGNQAGNITISSAISKTSGSTIPTLTLDAAGDINVNNTISASSGGLNVIFTAGDDVTIASNITTNGGFFSNSSDVFTIDALRTINTGGGHFTNSSNTVTWNGAVSTGGGTFSSTTQNATTMAGTLNAGSGTITFNVNADGAGGHNFTMNSGGSITSTNATSSALVVNVNAAAGGTGTATLRDITVGSGGTITIATNTGGNTTGGDILYGGTGTLSVGTGTVTLSTPKTSGENIGTSGSPLQINAGILNATAGSNGIFITNTGTGSFELNTIDTTGAFTLNSVASTGITNNGAMTIVGTTTITAGATQNVTLNNAGNDFSTVVLSSGKDVILVDSNAIGLGLSTISGILNVTSSGAITDSGALSVAGATTLAAGSANDITLNTAGNNFSSVGITTGNNVTLVDSNAIVLNASVINGTLNVTASGALTQNGLLTVSGAATFAAGAANNITLNSFDNLFNSVGITTGNNVLLKDADSIALNASTISGTLGVTTNGSITDNGALVVTGTATFAAGTSSNITLDTTTNNFSTVIVTSGNDVVLRDRNAIILGESTVGNLTVTATQISQSGALSGNTLIAKTLNNAGGDITLNTFSNDFANVNLKARNAADSRYDSGAIHYLDANGFNLVQDGVSDTIGIGTTATINLTAGGIITDAAGITGTTLTTNSVGGTILDFGSSVSGFNAMNSTSGIIQLVNAANLSITGISQSGGGDFVLSNTGTTTINGAVNTGTGNVDLTSTGDITDGTAGAITTNTLKVTTQNDQPADITLNNANLHEVTNIDLRTLNSAGTTNVAGAITFRDTTGFNVVGIGTTSTASLTAGGAISDSGAISAATLTSVSAGGAIYDFGHFLSNFSATNTGSGNVALVNTGDLTLTSVSQLVGNLTINNTGTLTTLTTLSANNVSITNTGSLVFGNSTISGSLDVTTGGSITDSGTMIVGGNATFDAGSGSITLDSADNDFNTVSVTNANAITLVDVNELKLGTLNLISDLSVRAGSNIFVNAPVQSTGAGNINMTPGGTGVVVIGASSITTNGGAMSFGPIVLANNLSLSSSNGNITLNSINGAYNLTLDSGSAGNITFNGNANLNLLTVLNTNDLTNNATLTLTGYQQNAGNTANFGDDWLHVNNGNAVITSNTILGKIDIVNGNATTNSTTFNTTLSVNNGAATITAININSDITTTGTTFITATNLYGTVNVGGLTLRVTGNVNLVNSSVDGSTGAAAIAKINYLPPPIGTQFFDGIDLAIAAEVLPKVPDVLSKAPDIITTELPLNVQNIFPVMISEAAFTNPTFSGAGYSIVGTGVKMPASEFITSSSATSRGGLLGSSGDTLTAGSWLAIPAWLTVPALANQALFNGSTLLPTMITAGAVSLVHSLGTLPFGLEPPGGTSALSAGPRVASLTRGFVDVSESLGLLNAALAMLAVLFAGSSRLTQRILNRTKFLANEYVTTMSFNLRTELNNILGVAGLLQEEKLCAISPQQKDFFAEIVNSSNQMNDYLAKLEKHGNFQISMLPEVSFELRTFLDSIAGFTQLINTGKAGPISSDLKNYLNDIMTSANALLGITTGITSKADKFVLKKAKTNLANISEGIQEFLKVHDMSPQRLSALSFTLRSHLNNIIGYVELLRNNMNDYISSDQYELLNDILFGAKDLQYYLTEIVEKEPLTPALLAHVSFKFRTTLTGIAGFAEVMQQEGIGKMSPDDKEYMQHIVSETSAVLQFLNETVEQETRKEITGLTNFY